MKILVTGASGQLGKAVVNLLRNTHTVALADLNQLDITDIYAIKALINNAKPDVIINCAAFTSVDLCETNIEDAYLVNALGPRNLAIVAQQIDAVLVHISTDYVFDGKSSVPLREDEGTFPTTIYGKSKLLGEKFVERFSSKYYILRTAWLYGDGDNFVRTMLKLARGNKKLQVVSDQFGSPTSTKELANCIEHLIKSESYGTYHATCEGQCSWYDFAKKIFEIMKIDVAVEKVTSDVFVRPAKRPSYSVLDNFMLKLVGLNTFSAWEIALEEYLKEDSEWQSSNL